MAHDLGAIERFHAAWMKNDANALRDLLADNVEWYISGRGALAGEQKGRDAVIALVARQHELTNGTFRPWREDSHDIIVSEHHVVLNDRYMASRDGKELDSHEAVFIHTEDGKIVSLLHYFFDQYAFDEFWS